MIWCDVVSGLVWCGVWSWHSVCGLLKIKLYSFISFSFFHDTTRITYVRHSISSIQVQHITSLYASQNGEMLRYWHIRPRTTHRCNSSSCWEKWFARTYHSTSLSYFNSMSYIFSRITKCPDVSLICLLISWPFSFFFIFLSVILLIYLLMNLFIYIFIYLFIYWDQLIDHLSFFSWHIPLLHSQVLNFI